MRGRKNRAAIFRGLESGISAQQRQYCRCTDGRDPLSLINYAIAELENDPDLTRAYCVFDRDGHATFDDAVNKAHQCSFGQCGRLRLAVSIPCFEVWPLLHFGFSTAPIVGGGGKSPGEQALAELQNAMPSYTKGDRKIFEKLVPRLEDGLRNAARLTAHNEKSGSNNPATDVHVLVEYLIRLKQ